MIPQSAGQGLRNQFINCTNDTHVWSGRFFWLQAPSPSPLATRNQQTLVTSALCIPAIAGSEILSLASTRRPSAMFGSLGSRTDLPAEIGLSRQLADDLDAVVRNGQPTCAQLAKAPVLRHYQLSARPVAVLTGYCTAHPTLRDGPIMTSEIYLTDPGQRWVRTLSCCDRLGGPAPDRFHDDPGSRS